MSCFGLISQIFCIVAPDLINVVYLTALLLLPGEHDVAPYDVELTLKLAFALTNAL